VVVRNNGTDPNNSYRISSNRSPRPLLTQLNSTQRATTDAGD